MPNGSGLRAQCLAEMLAGIARWRAATGVLREIHRGLALYDISRFKRQFLRPERAAFLAAVAAGKRRRAAA